MDERVWSRRMNDLISRAALLQEFETQTKVYRPNNLWHITGIKAFIENAPAVDAAEVIRCKDCKRWGTGVAGETEYVKCCEFGKYMVGANGFCVYGERK